jgi:hypothetical protein
MPKAISKGDKDPPPQDAKKENGRIVTLKDLAVAKALPVKFLQDLGLRNHFKNSALQ